MGLEVQVPHLGSRWVPPQRYPMKVGGPHSPLRTRLCTSLEVRRRGQKSKNLVSGPVGYLHRGTQRRRKFGVEEWTLRCSPPER